MVAVSRDPAQTVQATPLGHLRITAIAALSLALAGGCFDLRTDGVDWACGSDDECGSGFTCVGGTCRDTGSAAAGSACMAYVGALEDCYAQLGVPLDTSTLVDTCGLPSSDDPDSRAGFQCQAELLEEADCSQGLDVDFSDCW